MNYRAHLDLFDKDDARQRHRIRRSLPCTLLWRAFTSRLESFLINNVQSANHWSATTDAGDITRAWEVNFYFGNLAGRPESMVQSTPNFV